MMYYLFVRHHVMPMDYYKMGRGEKTMLLAFAEQEIADNKEAMKNAH